MTLRTLLGTFLSLAVLSTATASFADSYLGVSLVPVPASSRANLGSTQGALVVLVAVGSPAAEAGIMVGDVLLAFDGKLVTDAATLSREIATMAPARAITIDFIRRGLRGSLSATLKVRDEDRSFKHLGIGPTYFLPSRGDGFLTLGASVFASPGTALAFGASMTFGDKHSQQSTLLAGFTSTSKNFFMAGITNFGTVGTFGANAFSIGVGGLPADSGLGWQVTFHVLDKVVLSSFALLLVI